MTPLPTRQSPTTVTMSKPTIEEILPPKPEARPRIYAYSIDDKAHKGLLKVGQTTRDVKQRVAEQVKTAAIKNYKIELDEAAERDDGTLFTDHYVRAALVKKGFESFLRGRPVIAESMSQVLSRRRAALEHRLAAAHALEGPMRQDDILDSVRRFFGLTDTRSPARAGRCASSVRVWPTFSTTWSTFMIVKPVFEIETV